MFYINFLNHKFRWKSVANFRACGMEIGGNFPDETALKPNTIILVWSPMPCLWFFHLLRINNSSRVNDVFPGRQLTGACLVNEIINDSMSCC